MLEIYSYEYTRAANDERRTRALESHARLDRRDEGSKSQAKTGGAEVIEIAFAGGCPAPDQISA